MRHTFGKRIVSLILTAVLLLGMVVQIHPVAYATEEDTDTTLQGEQAAVPVPAAETEPEDPTQTDPTEYTPTESTPDESTPEMVDIYVTLINTKLLTAEGTEMTLPVRVEKGSTLYFQVAPKTGCQFDSLKINGNLSTAGANETVAITAEEEAAIYAKSIDVTAPKIVKVERVRPPYWTTKAQYKIEVSDNVPSVKVTAVNENGVSMDVTDNGDGTFTATTSAMGIYTITATDAGGNQATQEVTEIMIDLEAPVITSISRTTDRWSTGATYLIEATDTPSGIASITISDTAGNVISETTTSNGISCYLEANGIYTVTVVDKAGNSTEETFEETMVDSEGPVISNLRRVPISWATAATYFFTVTDSVSGVRNVLLNTEDSSTTLYPDEHGQYSFSVTENGSYYISASDYNNTVRKEVVETLIDSEAPKIESVTRSSEAWEQAAIYTVVATDADSGIREVQVTLNGETVETAETEEGFTFTAKENGTYLVSAVDNVGHTAQREVEENLIDTTAPEISKISRSPESWATASSYSFTVADTQSGVKSVIVKFGETETKITADNEGVYRFEVDTNGNYTITVADNAGNVRSASVLETYIDHEPPKILTITPQQTWDAEKNSVKFTVSDNAGVASVKIFAQDQLIAKAMLEKDAYIAQLTDNGTYRVLVTDIVGNTSENTFQISKIDKDAPSAPVLTSSANSVWSNQDTILTAKSEDTQSGIVAYWYTDTEKAFDKSVWQKMTLNDAAGSITLTAEQDATYRVVAEDGVGRVSSASSIWVGIDMTKAKISPFQRSPEKWAVTADYEITVEDTQSGVKTVELQFGDTNKILSDNGNGSYRFQAEANGTYTIRVTDVAGNVATASVAESYIDRVNPEILTVTTQQVWDAEKNAVEVTAQDNSGIAKVEIFSQEKLVATAALIEGKYTAYLYENGTYRAVVTDLVGNYTEQSFQIDHIDTEAPTVPVLTSSANGVWVNQDVTVNASATDTQSGVVAYWYTNTADAFSKTVWRKMEFDQGKGLVLLTEEVDADYRIVAEDEVGRVSAESTIWVGIDKTAPASVSITYLQEDGFNKILNGLYIYNDTMRFQATAADTASGISQYQYRIAGTAETQWVTVDADETGIKPLIDSLPDGIYSVEVRAMDIAGNWTGVYALATDGERTQFVLENTPENDEERMAAPELAAVTADGKEYTSNWTNQTVTITVSGSGAISGIAGYEYQLDYVDPSKETTDWTAVPVKDGIHAVEIAKDTNATIRIRAITNADNRSKFITMTLKVQKTAPKAATITFDPATGTNNWHTKLPKYQIHRPTQDGYGAPVSYRLEYSINNAAQEPIVYDGTNAPVIKQNGRWEISVIAVDAAGNIGVVDSSSILFLVDTQVPTHVDVLLDGNSILTGETGGLHWDKVNIENRIVISSYTIYLNDTIKIHAVANGGDSGLAAIYYMVLPDTEQFSLDGEWTLLTDEGITLIPDRKCNLFFKAVDNAGNITYFSGQSVILDAKAPVGANGSNLTLKVRDSNRSSYGYYNADVIVDIHVEEPVSEPYKVFSGLESITYRVLKDGEVSQSGQLYPGTGTATNLDGRPQAWDGTLVIDSQKNNSNSIVLEVTAKDAAGNIKVTALSEGNIKIDIDDPEMVSSYDRNDPISVFDGYDCFTGKRTLTVKVTERNLAASDSYIRVTDTDSGRVLPYKWISSGETHTATIEISGDGRYTVSALIQDLAGNKTTSMNFVEGTKAAYKFILDNTKPTIAISYDNNAVSQALYFNKPRTITVTVKERNFDPSQFNVYLDLTEEDGAERTIRVNNWSSSNSSTHTATYTCDTNGSYEVFASGDDALKNKAEDIAYYGMATRRFVIDQGIKPPVFTGVENNGSYSGAIIPSFTVTDKNLDNVDATLTWTGRDGEIEDVTKTMLGDLHLQDIEDGKKAILDVFPNAKDGIYTLAVSCTDKAGNRAQTQIVFSVNRSGSVYVYDDALVDIIGSYRPEVEEELTITEYNPSGFKKGSERVYITRNGEPIANPIFSVKVTRTPGGWYQLVYTISRENFLEDGTYTIVVSTEDAAGNIPENTGADMAIHFSVDTTPPELTSVVGMEKAICKADYIIINFTAMDNVELAAVDVYIDGELNTNIVDLDSYMKELGFVLREGFEQHVRIVVTDKAGNVLDTDSEDFNPGYGFEDKITVSSNFWLRFYANKPLFFGSIFALLLALAVAVVLILRKRKKNH